MSESNKERRSNTLIWCLLVSLLDANSCGNNKERHYRKINGKFGVYFVFNAFNRTFVVIFCFDTSFSNNHKRNIFFSIVMLLQSTKPYFFVFALHSDFYIIFSSWGDGIAYFWPILDYTKTLLVLKGAS